MPTRAELLGSWKLHGAVVLQDGAVVDPAPFGDAPSGVIHYLDDGRMSVLIAHSGRRSLSGGRTGASDAERLAAARSFIAYAGRYDVLADRVVHHVEINSHPNDVGVDYVRVARVEGGRLELSTPPDLPPDQRPMRLVWRRLAPGP